MKTSVFERSIALYNRITTFLLDFRHFSVNQTCVSAECESLFILLKAVSHGHIHTHTHIYIYTVQIVHYSQLTSSVSNLFVDQSCDDEKRNSHFWIKTHISCSDINPNVKCHLCTVLCAQPTSFNSFQLSFASELVGNIDNANYFIKWQTSARRLTWRSFVRPTIAFCTFNGLLDMMKVI